MFSVRLVLRSRNNHRRCSQAPGFCVACQDTCSVILEQSVVECLLFYPDFQCLRVLMQEENDGMKVDNCMLALKNNGNLIMKYLCIPLLTSENLIFLLCLVLTHHTPHCVSYQSFC